MTLPLAAKAEPTDRACTYLSAPTLPGWLGSGPTHWQSRWEQAYGFERVEQDDWLWLRRGDWPQGMALLRSLAAHCAETPRRAHSVASATND